LTTIEASERDPRTGPADSGEDDGRAARTVPLSAYGSARSSDEILPYYTHVRGGRRPSPEALSELEHELQRREGSGWRVVVGVKHSYPFIEDAMGQLIEDGDREVVGLVLAPHFSVMSIGEYADRAQRADGEADGPLQLRFVPDWHLASGYLAWLGSPVQEELEAIPMKGRSAALVVFTAHSLPARLREMGDPYPDHLGETAARVSKLVGLPRWTTAWQSVAKTGEPWLGPELLEVVREAAAAGTTDFVVCACAFTADHLEVLYDLDIEAQAETQRIGVRISRTPMPNADPASMAILAKVVQAQTAADS
jgi:ferrochelatase